MKITTPYLIIIALFFAFYSCKENKNTTEGNKDIINSKEIETNQATSINLEPIQKDVPSFNQKEADEFIEEAKKYFANMVEATQKEDNDRKIELQFKANEIDEKYQTVKEKLNPEQQQILTNWYMKLVETASK